MVVYVKGGITIRDIEEAMKGWIDKPKDPEGNPFSQDMLDAMEIVAEDRVYEEEPKTQEVLPDPGEDPLVTLKRALANQKLSKHQLEARKRDIQFAVETVGITAVHPNEDPKMWPAPTGQNIYEPDINCLRQDYKDVIKDDETIKKDYELLCNRVEIHTCKDGYCIQKKKPTKKRTGKDTDKKESEKNKKASEKKADPCRFNFPKPFHGYKPTYEEEGGREMLIKVERNKENPEKFKDIVNGKIAPLGAS